MLKRALSPLIITAFALLLSACAPDQDQPLPTAALQLTSQPTATPTEVPRAILYFLTDTDPADPLRAQAESALSAFAAQNNQDLHILSDPAALDFSVPSFAVVPLGSYPQLPELAASQPDTTILQLNAAPDAAASPNFITLAPARDQSEIAAFLAGYAAAISTDDWRVAALYLPEDLTEAIAFIAGVEYFCGACAPVAPPYNNYPQAFQTDLATWQLHAQEAINQGVRTVYLSPGLDQPEIYEYFAARGLLLLGPHYPGDAYAASWLATFSPGSQAALIEDMLTLLSGGSPAPSGPSAHIANPNANFLSLLRIEHINALLADVEAGYIAVPSQVD